MELAMFEVNGTSIKEGIPRIALARDALELLRDRYQRPDFAKFSFAGTYIDPEDDMTDFVAYASPELGKDASVISVVTDSSAPVVQRTFTH